MPDLTPLRPQGVLPDTSSLFSVPALRKVEPTMELCEVGQRKWNSLPERVFSYAPPELLTAYCQSYATWEYYEKMFRGNPRLRVAEKFNMEGDVIGEVVSPEAKLAADALKQMQSLAKQLQF